MNRMKLGKHHLPSVFSFRRVVCGRVYLFFNVVTDKQPHCGFGDADL